MSRRISLDIEKELSQRELQLLVHATRGLTDQAIANELAISLATIATYWGRIRIKLGPLNRTELVAKYLEYKSTEEIFQLVNEAEILRRQLGEAKEDDSELLLALNKFPDVVVLLDEQANVLYVNEEFSAQTGYSASEIVGQNLLNIYPEGRYERLHSFLKGMLSDPKNPEFSQNRLVYIRHINGELQGFNCNSKLYETDAGVRIIVSARETE
jgi:PAS domain S-box-containing protein